MNNYRPLLKIFSRILLLSLIIILSVIAGSREVGSDNDSVMYATIVQNSVNGVYNLLQKEPGFWLIVYLNNLLAGGSIASFFFVYSFIALCLCFYGIKKTSPSPIISIIMYLAFFFIVHEMMQIRIAFAAGFIYLTFFYLVVERKKTSIFISAVAVLFHYSTIISFIFFFIKPRNIITKKFLVLPVIGAIFGFAINSNQSIAQAFFDMMPSFLSYKATLYFALNSEGSLTRVSAVVMGFGSLIYYSLLVFMYGRIKGKDLENAYYRSLNLLLKITSIQLFLGFILIFNVEFSNRIFTYIGVLTFPLLPAFFIKEFSARSRVIVFVPIAIYAIRQFYTSYNSVFMG
ncbi:TPA: EpsG family protein [Klebsiella michiganensis]